MSSKRGKCVACGRQMVIVGYDRCGKCYKIHRKVREIVDMADSAPKVAEVEVSDRPYPRMETYTVWLCSDGTEFSEILEVKALRHELALTRRK